MRSLLVDRVVRVDVNAALACQFSHDELAANDRVTRGTTGAAIGLQLLEDLANTALELIELLAMRMDGQHDACPLRLEALNRRSERPRRTPVEPLSLLALELLEIA
jgi:hypothetical protein